MLVGEDAEGCGAVLLIAQGNDVGASVLLDPALRGRAALELGDDTRVGGEESGAQGGAGDGGQTAVHERRNGSADGGELLTLMGDDLFEDVHGL